MNEDLQQEKLTLDARVARLEGALGFGKYRGSLSAKTLWFIMLLGLIALVLAYYGMGLPNHYFQVVFAMLTLLLAYHRGWLIAPKNALLWLLALINLGTLSMVYKLLIGLGSAQPLAWLKYPQIQQKDSEQTLAILPNLSLVWSDTSLSAISIDFTVIQSFLLLITLIGSLFAFQPFASLTAFLLLLLALPALLTFNWELTFWALIIFSVSLYLQAAAKKSV